MTSSPRLISLVPSITELLITLGLTPWIVGRTGFCIHPRHEVANIPKVGGTKDVNLAKIQRLAPTHVFVNVDENTWPTVQALQDMAISPPIQVIVTHPCSPADNLALIDQVLQSFTPDFIATSAINLPAIRLKQQLNAALQALTALDRPQKKPPERVLYLIWREPWMTVARDTYISRMLGLIGWQTWPATLGGPTGAARYPVVGVDEPWLAEIDRVLLSSEPYSFGAEHLQEVQAWLPHAKVQLVDGELLSWYGSRAVAGLAYLQTLLDEAPGELIQDHNSR